MSGEKHLSDEELVKALRSGDEDAFGHLVEAHHASLVRFARLYVSSVEVAEEAVQETWVAVVRGIDRFEGRSALKTWLYGILINCARKRGREESRTLPFSTFDDADASDEERAVGPDRFQKPGDRWSVPPSRWDELPESRLLARETGQVVEAALKSLSPSQREVVVLRDLAGLTSAEVCATLGITEVNQRVLLHRGRARLRAALERYFDEH